jgi:hypothetical protein
LADVLGISRLAKLRLVTGGMMQIFFAVYLPETAIRLEKCYSCQF